MSRRQLLRGQPRQLGSQRLVVGGGLGAVALGRFGDVGDGVRLGAGFTLKVYIHLMDSGVGDAAFMDEAVKVGNGWATSHPVEAANDEPAELAQTA
jgi:hypothetical protein